MTTLRNLPQVHDADVHAADGSPVARYVRDGQAHGHGQDHGRDSRARAEGYTVGLKEGHQIGRSVMTGVIEQDVRRDIGGDVQRISSLDTNWSAETFKHILLPLWLAAYKFRGRSFRFIVNGQTGEVQGERHREAA